MLSVVIPAYNEDHRLGPTLEQVLAFLDARGGDYEVLVVDDGSTDETAALAESYGVKVLRQPDNRGKGAAVRAGMLAAAGDPILFSDADLATPIEELAKLEAALAAGADIAIASRAVEGADIRTRQHVLRELSGRFFNLLVRATGAGPFLDTQCGFKLFSRAAARDVFSRAQVDGFAFDVEALLLARGRYRVVEVPVAWHHVEESKVSGFAGAKAFLDMLTLRWRVRGR